MNSLSIVKKLIKTDSTNKIKALKAGNFVIYKYNPKKDDVIYDKTPLVFILWTSKSYVLGLNIHWCPLIIRKTILNHIFKVNSKNIKENKPLDYDYKRFKPLLWKIGALPVVRLYIRKRISDKVVLIPTNRIMEICTLKTETFTNGVPDWVMYKRARSKIKRKK